MTYEIVEQWLATVGPSSARIYLSVATEFLSYIAPKMLTDLNAETANAWCLSLTGLETTRARKVSTIASLLAFAYQGGYMKEDLSTGLKRVLIPPRPRPTVGADLAERIIQGARSTRDRAVLRLLYDCDLCSREVAELIGEQVGDNSLQVSGRRVPVPEGLLQDVKVFVTTPREPVFRSFRSPFNALSEREVRGIVYKAAKEAGLEKTSSHVLRRARLEKALKQGSRERPYGLVYGLYDPMGPLRYVGQTRQSAERRLASHLSADRLTGNSRVAQWLRALMLQGLEPTVAVLATAQNKDELLYLERHHIREAQRDGARLVNSMHSLEGRFRDPGHEVPVLAHSHALALADAIEAHLAAGGPDPSGRLAKARAFYHPARTP